MAERAAQAGVSRAAAERARDCLDRAEHRIAQHKAAVAEGKGPQAAEAERAALQWLGLAYEDLGMTG